MSSNPLVSHQRRINNTKSIGDVYVTEIIDWIRTGRYSSEVGTIRAMSLRGASKKEIDSLKAELLPTYTPHGTFTYRNSSGLLTESNIAFIDIDGKDNLSLTTNEIKKKLTTLPFVFAAYISSTGTGVHALAATDSIRDDYSAQTQTEASTIVYSIVCSETGLVCDHSCKDISRACFISHDTEAYFNEARLPHVTNVQAEKVSLARNEPEGFKHNKLTIPSLRFRGPVNPLDFEGKPYLHFHDGVPYFKVWLPDTRCGHRKRSLYHALAQLCIGNPDVTKEELMNISKYLNRKLEKQLEETYLESVVKSIVKRQKKQGFTTSFIKKTLFNPDYDISPRQKQSIAAVNTAKMKRDNTTKKINEAIEVLKSKEIKPTQKAVAELSGLSLITVKRNWKK